MYQFDTLNSGCRVCRMYGSTGKVDYNECTTYTGFTCDTINNLANTYAGKR